jgi:hypothetical protein
MLSSAKSMFCEEKRHVNGRVVGFYLFSETCSLNIRSTR